MAGRVGYVPFAPSSTYDYGPGSKISELILRAGENAARAQAAQGDIWGGAVADLGQQAGAAIGDYQAQKAAEAKARHEQERKAQMGQFATATMSKGFNFDEEIAKLPRELQPEAISFFQTQEKSKAEAAKARAEMESKESYRLADAAFRLKQALGTPYEPIARDLMQRYYSEDYPEQASQLLQMPADQLMPVLDGMIGGSQEFQKQQAEIAEKQAQTEKIRRPEPKKYKDVETAAGIQAFDPETGTLGPVIARGKPVQAAMPSFQSKEVLDDQGKATMANFDARTGQYIDASTRQPIKNPRPVPSATESAEARKFQNAAPVLKSMEELSEKINTLQGLKAKAVGEKAKLEADLNLNDNVAEYEALISGFTPLVARSLGHTGVLTEQDVQSVKALFPKPGDSKTLRDRKVARVKSIIGDLGGTVTESSPMRLKYNPATGKLE